jgi:DNA-binding CsgD family transcriptional regulator
LSARGPLLVNNTHVMRARAIAPNDASAAAAWIIRELPVPRDLATSLPTLLARLISEEVLRGELVEYVHGRTSPPVFAAFGLSSFLSNATAAQYLASPYPYLELQLLGQARQSSRSGAFLSYDEIAEGNAGVGLTLFPLMWLQRSNDAAKAETRALLAACQQSFIRIHRGYRLSRILKEAPANRGSAFLAGGFREHHRLVPGTPHRFAGRTLKQEHVIFEVSRSDVEAVPPGTAISHLFAYQPPRCGLTRSEKQVLERSVSHQTDAKIAAGLGITPSAVALRWRSIYARVAAHVPSALENDPSSSSTVRGKEKRRRVIAFVSDYPEEMRPYSQP